jgi:hypothetical protein
VSDVSNFALKADITPCVCGCGLEARPRVKAWQDGLGPHARGCVCRRCTGSRQRGRSRVRENKVAKATGGTREPLSGGLSGIDGRSGLWVWEETAQESIVRGFRRWVTSKGVTSKLARIMARHGEARAFVLSWDGKPRWVCVPFDDWAGQVRDENGGAA